MRTDKRQAVPEHRKLAVLELFRAAHAEMRPPPTTRDVSRELGISQAWAYAIMLALHEEDRLVTRGPNRGFYLPQSAWARHTQAMREGLAVASVTKEQLAYASILRLLHEQPKLSLSERAGAAMLLEHLGEVDP